MTMKGLSPTLAGGFAAVFAFSVAAVAMAPLSSFADKAEATPIKEVILVAKNHLDVGFTCTVPELMRRIRTTDLESILKLLDADSAKPEGQRVRWMLPAWSMDVALSGEYSPERRVRLEEAVRKAIPGVKVRFGDPSEFADAIIAEEKENPTLPVIRGDMPDTWIHGLMSAPEETAIHRHAQTELITLGILDTTLRAFGLDTKPVAKTLDRAYRKSGLYSEHTWGLSCQRERKRFHDPDWRERYERGDFKHIDAALEYHREYARDAHRMAQDGIRERMEMLAKSVDAEGPRVVVFNPLPHARDAVVEVEIPDGGKMTFLAKDIPAGGYKTFTDVFNRVERAENLHDLHVLHGSKSKGGIAVSRKGVRVTAFCPNPDGRGTVLRVWEQAGNGGEITITLPKGMNVTEARPVNLRGERAGEPIAVKDGTFSFELGAWSPKSFVLIGGAESATPHTFDKTLAYSRQLDVPRELPEDVIVYPIQPKQFGDSALFMA